MNSRLAASLSAFVFVGFAFGSDAIDQFLQAGRTRSKLTGSVVSMDQSVVAYRNGDDPIVHKRPGSGRAMGLTLTRGWASQSPAFDGLLASILAGNLRQTLISLSLQRPGAAPDTEDYELTGEAEVRLPAMGVHFTDADAHGPVLLMKAKEKANRTKCGNNLRTMPPGRPQGFSGGIEGLPGECLGWSELKIRVQATYSDGTNDRFVVDSGDITFTMKVSETDLQKWEFETREAAQGGGPCVRAAMCLPKLEGGKEGFISMGCTLISYTPRADGAFDVVCATESVSMRPVRIKTPGAGA